VAATLGGQFCVPVVVKYKADRYATDIDSVSARVYATEVKDVAAVHRPNGHELAWLGWITHMARPRR
jgi:hypothetical protein